VSTLPAIDEAAAPPAIAQIMGGGATGPLGFVHPHTGNLSASSVTVLLEQRRERTQARDRQLSEKDTGPVAESWMGLVLPSNRARVLLRRLDRTARRLLREVRRTGAIRATTRFGVGSAIEARTRRHKTVSLICDIMSGKSTWVWRRYCIVR
jgi:hypothetical protein